MLHHFSQTTGHQRVAYSALVGVGVAALPLGWALQTHILFSWCCMALSYLGLAWWLVWTFDAQRTRLRASAQDQSEWVLFAILLCAVFASIAAISFILHRLQTFTEAQKYGHLLLSLIALAASWLLMQTTFAFRYAHRYYERLSNPEPAHARRSGAAPAYSAGLVFPGKELPDYFDFMYYAYVVGMTSQVSDVVVTSRAMRHLTLWHSVSAFAFNMLVLALSVNVIASVIA